MRFRTPLPVFRALSSILHGTAPVSVRHGSSVDMVQFSVSELHPLPLNCPLPLISLRGASCSENWYSGSACGYQTRRCEGSSQKPQSGCQLMLRSWRELRNVLLRLALCSTPSTETESRAPRRRSIDLTASDSRSTHGKTHGGWHCDDVDRPTSVHPMRCVCRGLFGYARGNAPLCTRRGGV